MNFWLYFPRCQFKLEGWISMRAWTISRHLVFSREIYLLSKFVKGNRASWNAMLRRRATNSIFFLLFFIISLQWGPQDAFIFTLCTIQTSSYMNIIYKKEKAFSLFCQRERERGECCHSEGLNQGVKFVSYKLKEFGMQITPLNLSCGHNSAASWLAYQLWQ